jgi:hypothetical protein
MPKRVSKVRRHERRKPHKQDRVNVHEYDRTIDLVAPRGNEKKFMRARKAFANRSPRAQAQDLRLEAADTGMIDEPGFLDKWLDHPAELDLFGVDDVVYGPKLTDLATIKQLLERRRGVIKQKAHETVVKAKEHIKRIAKAPIPRTIKKARIAEVKKAVKKKIHEEVEREKEVVKTVIRKVAERAVRASKPWSRERKKRANTVAGVVGCNAIEADQLIRRASLANVDYDRVDWDAIQGKDLEYTEWLEKLERQTGKTFTEDEYMADIKAQADAFDLMHQEIEAEVEHDLTEPGLGPREHEFRRRSIIHPESLPEDPYAI